jgi:Flp pilus assembly protein TadG
MTKHQARSWLADRHGNVTIVYALALVPTIALMGLGIDWYKEQSYKKRLDAAADAAALAAITTAKTYVVNNPNQTNAVNNAVTAGIAQAQKVFRVNAGTAELQINVTPQINFPVPTTQTYTATVSYSTSMPTSFGGIVGYNTFQLQGSATSSLTIGQYIDFYVAIDVSGSMGIPTTTAGQQALAAINPDQRALYPTGCVFACHYVGNTGYTLAEASNIALRVDTVGQALTSLISTATSTEQMSGIANEFRIGLYPFIVHAIDAAPLSASFTQATQVAQSLGSTYLDQGWANPPTASNGTQLGSGGTHFENLSTDLPNYIKTPLINGKVGNGQTSTQPKAVLFLITDGADNSQTYTTWGNFTGSNPQLPTTNFCTLAQSYGFTVAVLYIPYVPITNPNPRFAGDEDDKVNAIVPQIPTTLQNCATPGFFFTASSPSDINNAMQTMFFQSLQAARLTQ